MTQGLTSAPSSPSASQIGTRVWSYAGVLKDDGLSYMGYVEQLTFLLFLKMADELTRPPYNQPNRIPQGKDKKGKPVAYDWSSLLAKDGAELYQHYRDALDSLGTQPGLLGTIFKEAECKIKDPAKLRRLIADLINREKRLSLDLDVKGVIHEELLSRSAAESSGGAGQYLTPRPISEGSELDTEVEGVVRQDFWVSAANRQLSLVAHIFDLLAVSGRAAVVVPDHGLFEGGPGQKIRQQLLQQCDVHTLLRLPTGI